MKTILLAVTMLTMCFTSCKKDEKGPTDEEILTKKIEEIIPSQYLDSLKKLGLTVNNGTTPPDVQGIYDILPVELVNSNIPTDYAGMSFHDAKLKLFNQSSKDFGIQLYGKYFLAERDTSIVTAISGSGNNITIYGKVKSYLSGYTAIFALILSGIKEGDHFKNVKYGIINIDNSNGGTAFIKEGQGRVVYDTDNVSESSTVFKIGQPSTNGNNLTPALMQ